MVALAALIQRDAAMSKRACLPAGYWGGKWPGRKPPRTLVAHNVLAPVHYGRLYIQKVLGAYPRHPRLHHSRRAPLSCHVLCAHLPRGLPY